MASLGFLFDIYEVLVAPLVLQPAVMELGGFSPGTAEYRYWTGLLFWIPPLVGGFCGLWGGYLADRFGRRRILVWSILLYTVSALSAGMSTRMETLLLFRALCFAGMCVEFIAAVAWLAELFPGAENTRSRARLHAVVLFARRSPGRRRILSRESLRRRSPRDLRRTFRVALHVDLRLRSRDSFDADPAVPAGISAVAAASRRGDAQASQRRGTCSGRSFAAARSSRRCCSRALMEPRSEPCSSRRRSPRDFPKSGNFPTSERGQATAGAQTMQELGGLAGRFAIASLGLLIVSRRTLLRLFLIPGLIVTPIVFFYTGTHSLELFRIGVFMAGFITIAQLTFLGNYMPRIYPLHLRGTGEGFAANVGGRMLGTSASFVTTHLAAVMPAALPGAQLAYAAAVVGIGVYLLALVLTFWLPEPPEKLPD